MTDMAKGIAIGMIGVLTLEGFGLILMAAILWSRDKYREHRRAKWQNRKITKEE